MTLFAAVPCGLDPAGDGRVRHRDWNLVERLIDAEDARLLPTCELFRTRDAHVGGLARAGARDAAARFDRWLARGLVADAASLLAPSPQLPVLRDRPASAPLLVVRSYERPEGLKRLLDSIRRDGAKHGVAHELAVVDDTRDPAKGEATRVIVEAFSRGRGARTWLVGPGQRPQAFAALESAVPVARELRDLLDPDLPSAITGSRTWNWAVLLAAGRTLSILDDDTSFPLRCFSGGNGRLELADSTEAVLRYFDDASWADAEPLEIEPYAFMASWLGRDTTKLVASHGWREDALPLRSPMELLHLRGGRRVVGVVPGLYGGIAFNSSVYLLAPNPPSAASLFSTPYRHGRLDADAVWHGYPQPRVTSHAVYTPLLLDDGALLPFAGTWGRVDDTYFLALLSAIAPEAAFAHVPAMLGHADISPRHRLRSAIEPLLLDRNAGVAATFLENELPGARREGRLFAVGMHCAKVAKESDATLAERAIAFRNAMLARVVNQLQAGLDIHRDAPREWRATVERALTVNRATITFPAPDATEIDLLRRAYAQAARACEVWPVLWNAAAANGGFLHDVAVALD